MRIQFSTGHGNEATLFNALKSEQDAGRIARHVSFKLINELRNARRTPDYAGRAFNVQLEAWEKDRGRRSGNSGSYGPVSDGSYTATYDEWGHFLTALYVKDSNLLVGTQRYPIYSDYSNFVERTGMTYAPNLATYIENNGDPYPIRTGRNLIGRRGAGRTNRDTYGWGTLDPRTAEWARAFRAGEVF